MGWLMSGLALAPPADPYVLRRGTGMPAGWSARKSAIRYDRATISRMEWEAIMREVGAQGQGLKCDFEN